ncbi:DUF397 domain-containing protein [Yinghuangia soli]|uniref:DUF397 domain-containing protein n=1 Tax=Yinghuangia soli TaxID=2908204 RepID=A0AA41U041_9ACTN|nr:DUF397 domain-containing protein [Yinghuangia soli]MCF2526037.1 DUF397 domain-containing protein [Yinghuangia soli]
MNSPAKVEPSDWRKSSYSGNGTECVEMGVVDAGILVRDSKVADGPRVTATVAGWRSFVAELAR